MGGMATVEMGKESRDGSSRRGALKSRWDVDGCPYFESLDRTEGLLGFITVICPSWVTHHWKCIIVSRAPSYIAQYYSTNSSGNGSWIIIIARSIPPTDWHYLTSCSSYRFYQLTTVSTICNMLIDLPILNTKSYSLYFLWIYLFLFQQGWINLKFIEDTLSYWRGFNGYFGEEVS